MSVPRIEFELSTSEPGWLRIALEIDGRSIDERASWQSDPLADLIDQATQLASFEKPEFGLIRTVRFHQEPGLSTWEMKLFEDRTVELRANWTSEAVNELPRVALHTRTTSLQWAVALRDAAMRLLTRHGLSGYVELWGLHEFPTARLLGLIDAIDQLEGRSPRRRTLADEAAWLTSLVTRA